MNKRRIKKIAIGSIVTFMLLFIVLVIHIVIVTRPSNYPNSSIQLSRIDFEDPVDSSTAACLEQKLRSIKGVSNTYFNIPDGKLVYMHDLEKITGEKVYDLFKQDCELKSNRYLPDAQTIASGCPVMDKNSLSYKFSSAVKNIFH